MLTGNRGEWSEPYVLLKLIADRKLYLGGKDFSKVDNLFYPIIKIIRHEKHRNVSFSYDNNIIIIKDDSSNFRIPIKKFIENAAYCFERISNQKAKKGSFSLPLIENFLNEFSITSLKAKSKLKNDITISFQDPKSFISPTLGFSIKSQLGRPSTLLNSSNATNFTYNLVGPKLSDIQIDEVNNTRLYHEKISLIESFGCELIFDKIEHPIFRSNLQTIDYNFDKMLSRVVLKYYSTKTTREKSVPNLVEYLTTSNIIGYDLSINDEIYRIFFKKFLTDYALGMRAAEVWKRDIQATGGYLIVRDDGELICYHFYFAKSFEDYIFDNTRLDTPDSKKHDFGEVYWENNSQKIKLNLQIRFIK